MDSNAEHPTPPPAPIINPHHPTGAASGIYSYTTPAFSQTTTYANSFYSTSQTAKDPSPHIASAYNKRPFPPRPNENCCQEVRNTTINPRCTCQCSERSSVVINHVGPGVMYLQVGNNNTIDLRSMM